MCDIGMDISITHTCTYRWKNYALNFKKLELDFKGYLGKTPKVISNQNLFSRVPS